eukprot:sb/3461790/
MRSPSTSIQPIIKGTRRNTNRLSGLGKHLFLEWCRETKTSLDNPLKVLIQVKEVSRIKSQKQEMVDTVSRRGEELEDLENQVTEFITHLRPPSGVTTADAEAMVEEAEVVQEKLKLVQEEYTIILEEAKAASKELQETMERVEKVVYWYNCLQQYLKNSRKRLEMLDPVATDLVDVQKQLKNCKVITTELESKEELIEEMMRESEQLLALADTDQLYVVPADLGDKVTSFKADWKKFCTKCGSQEKRLDRTYGKLKKLDSALEKILRWQGDKEKELAAAPPIASDPVVIQEQLDQARSLRAIVDGCEAHINTANELARSLIYKGKAGSTPPLKVKLEKINEGWKRMDLCITTRLSDLEAALKRSQTIEKSLDDINRWLEEKEGQVAHWDKLDINREPLQDHFSRWTELRRDVHGYEPVLSTTKEKALQGLSVDDADRMKDRLAKLQDRYNKVREAVDRNHTMIGDVHKGVDDIRRAATQLDGQVERAAEQMAEMNPLATNIPALNNQLREVNQLLDTLDAVKPELAGLAKQCDNVCDLQLVKGAPKAQKELLDIPAMPGSKTGAMERGALDRKKQIEDRIGRLQQIEEDLAGFIEDLTRVKKDFDKKLSNPNLSGDEKKKLLEEFEDTKAGLEKKLDRIRGEVETLCDGVEDTPMVKRRLQEAEQKLRDFTAGLDKSKDLVSQVDDALKRHEKGRLDILDDLLLQSTDISDLEPISVNVATATAQSLQTMNLCERCEGLKRRVNDLDDIIVDVKDSIPAPTKGNMESSKETTTQQLDDILGRLKSRGDTLDSVLPFVTHLQDMESDTLPWLEDVERWVVTEATKPSETADQISERKEGVKGKLKEVEDHKGDIDDITTYGESALELVTGYDPNNVCQSARDLEAHVADVQKRYDAVKCKLEEIEVDLTNKENLAARIGAIGERFIPVKT